MDGFIEGKGRGTYQTSQRFLFLIAALTPGDEHVNNGGSSLTCWALWGSEHNGNGSAEQAKDILLNREPRFMYDLYGLNLEGAEQSVEIYTKSDQNRIDPCLDWSWGV